MNHPVCGTSHPLVVPEVRFLVLIAVLIAVVATVLAVAGPPTLGAIVVTAETVTLGIFLLLGPRREGTGELRVTEA
ncbi:hypothetical protein ACIQNG_08835 [Streptomyces sp. NPDC091377]|uniref:hypothetical protein n=1 Tax=unclassified Streptomyces TaxID=2593676 RepID=UPI00380FB7F4